MFFERFQKLPISGIVSPPVRIDPDIPKLYLTITHTRCRTKSGPSIPKTPVLPRFANPGDFKKPCKMPGSHLSDNRARNTKKSPFLLI
jgi:hypothetical protein